MNSAAASFNTTMAQMTELPQQKKQAAGANAFPSGGRVKAGWRIKTGSVAQHARDSVAPLR